MRSALKKGFVSLSYNKRLKGDNTDIIQCALTNNFEGVDRALAADPRAINAQRSGSGITALMAASGRGLERMVEYLLSKDGVDVSISDDFCREAIHHARPFPKVIAILTMFEHPELKWKETAIFRLEP